MDAPTIASYQAQMALGRLLLACLFAANLAGWFLADDVVGQRGAILALVAIFSAWLSQGFYTAGREVWGHVYRWACLAFAGGAAFSLFQITL